MNRISAVFALASLALSPLLSGLFWMAAYLLPSHTAQRLNPQQLFSTKLVTHKKTTYLIVVWLVLSLLTGLLCQYPELHLAGILSRYFLPALLCWMSYRALIQGQIQTKDLIRGLLLASLLLACIGLGNLCLHWAFSKQWLCISGFDSACLLSFDLGRSDRAQALAMHPNILGTLLCLSLPLWFWQLNAARGVFKFPVFACLAPVLMCLALTYSRAAWLAAVIALFWGSIWLLNASWRLTVCLCSLLGVFALFVKSPELWGRLQSLLQPTQGSGGTRLAIWHTGLQILHDFALTGVGLLHVEARYVAYRSLPIEAAHLHNLYLQVAVESGIFAAVILFGLLMYVLRKPTELDASAQAAWLSWLSLGLISWLDCPSLDLRVSWFAMALLAVILFERKVAQQARQLQKILAPAEL